MLLNSVCSHIILASFLPFFVSSPCEESYIIQVPNNINIEESGTFNINIIENNLKSNQTLHINFDDEFVLRDSHGKDDISGYISGGSFDIKSSDTQSKTISYSVPQLSVGNWSGNLNMNLSLETEVLSNTLMDGKSINDILSLNSVKPNYVVFSNDVMNVDYDYDISEAQDESVLLYVIDEETVVISNNANKKIIANSDLSDMFSNLSSLLEVRNMNLLDMSYCEDISGMFKGSNHLSSITGINQLDTSKIRDMSETFRDTRALKNLDISSWDVSGTENMSYMFSGYAGSSLNCINSWDISSVKDMSYMFSNSSLVSLDLSRWDVSGVTNMSNMFFRVNKMTSLDISGWNTQSCTDMSSMFENCSRLTSLNTVGTFDMSCVETIASMFAGCTALDDIGSLENWDVSNVKDMSSAFYKIKASTVGDLSGWDVSNVETFENMFGLAQSLNNVSYLSGWNVSSRCRNLSSMFDAATYMLPSSLDLGSWDVSNVENMNRMFYGCNTLKTLNIQGWDTGNLKTAVSMFEYNSRNNYNALTSIIGIETLDTHSLENISKMFKLCRHVNVDISPWNTSSLTNISEAFYDCDYQNLTLLENFDVSNVTDMTDCFGGFSGAGSSTSPPSWYLN